MNAAPLHGAYLQSVSQSVRTARFPSVVVRRCVRKRPVSPRRAGREGGKGRGGEGKGGRDTDVGQRRGPGSRGQDCGKTQTKGTRFGARDRSVSGETPATHSPCLHPSLLWLPSFLFPPGTRRALPPPLSSVRPLYRFTLPPPLFFFWFVPRSRVAVERRAR